MNYEFTQDCEIKNCEFRTGEIVAENAVQFFPAVMKQTEKEATLEISKVGDNLIKKEKSLTPAKKSTSKKKAQEVIAEEVPETPVAEEVSTEETSEEEANEEENQA